MPTITAFLRGRIAEDSRNANDNQRALREAAAKRAILNAHKLVPAQRAILNAHKPAPAQDIWGTPIGGTGCDTCDLEFDLILGCWEIHDTGGCVTLKALAAIYSDHPDYLHQT